MTIGDDSIGMKMDAIKGQLGKAGCMYAARSWIIDERVASAAHDESGFSPSFRQRERGNRGRSRLRMRSHSVPRSILGT